MEAGERENQAPGYPHLSLCILDAVWTPGVTVGTVRNVIARYCASAGLPVPGTMIGEGVSAQPLQRFIDAIEVLGTEQFAADALQNRQRTVSVNGILKAEAAYRVAQELAARQVESPSQMTLLHADLDFERAFRAIPGLGPATLNRLYALCDLPPSETSPSPAPRRRKKREESEPQEPQNDEAPPPVIAPPVSEPLPVPEAPLVVEIALAPTVVETEISDERYTVRIPDMPTDERPRERLQHFGAEALSHAELIAILLRTGTEQYNAVQVAERLLADNDGLRGVAQMTMQEMSQISGIGLAKAAQIKAAIELGRRLVAENPDARYRIRSPQDVHNLLGPRLRDEKREHFIALLLDAKGGVMRQETISIGDLSSSIVNPREVFRPAVRHSASSIIVAHNHPSGDTTPSPEDIAVTRQLIEAGKLLSVEVLDHIILGDNRFLSLKERNLI